MKSFVCSSCFAITRRVDGALPPSFCPFCHGTELFDTGSSSAHSVQPVPASPEAQPAERTAVTDGEEPRTVPQPEAPKMTVAYDERPCERGEPCARLSGVECPGGRGC